MIVLAWVAAAIVGALLTDRLLLLMERRGWIYWRRRKPGIGAASTNSMMGELHTLFSPSRQHVNEEKERRLVLRDDADAGTPLDRRVDLDSGHVVVRPDRTAKGDD
ncbi:DUF6191 domain-containing protein [Kitasatospora sp. NPDC047058]|uniref:DUF6191 domain-containing protein n=1 Tax=Kitasatospora sp. NPDC047058 TaxID=3155620 RepID=UPI0033E9753C